MSSKESNKTVLLHKRQLLRSLTNPNAISKASIIVEASKYIQELKQKFDASKQAIAEKNSLPVVSVETLEKGFLVNVLSEKSFPRLLVFVLEALENLGLDVLNADISCSHELFRFEAIGGHNKEEKLETQMVKQAVLQSIKNCLDGEKPKK